MAKTRYSRKVSKRNGATKRKGATKRRANTKRRGMKNKRRGGSLFGDVTRAAARAAERAREFGSQGVSGVKSAVTSAKVVANNAATFAANNVGAAAKEPDCIGMNDKLAEAQAQLKMVQDKITSLEDELLLNKCPRTMD